MFNQYYDYYGDVIPRKKKAKKPAMKQVVEDVK